RGATVEKPARRRMINPQNVQTGLAHQRQIDVYLLRRPEIIPIRVRLERPVRDALNEEFLFAFEKELRPGSNPGVCLHSVSSLSLYTAVAQRFNCRGSRVGCRAQHRRRHAPCYSSAKASRTTATVRSMSSGVCAVEMNPVSN